MSTQTVEKFVAIDTVYRLFSPPRTDRWATAMLHRDILQLELRADPQSPSIRLWILPDSLQHSPSGVITFTGYVHESPTGLRGVIDTLDKQTDGKLPADFETMVQFVHGIAENHPGKSCFISPYEIPLPIAEHDSPE